MVSISIPFTIETLFWTTDIHEVGARLFTEHIPVLFCQTRWCCLDSITIFGFASMSVFVKGVIINHRKKVLAEASIHLYYGDSHWLQWSNRMSLDLSIGMCWRLFDAQERLAWYSYNSFAHWTHIAAFHLRYDVKINKTFLGLKWNPVKNLNFRNWLQHRWLAMSSTTLSETKNTLRDRIPRRWSVTTFESSDISLPFISLTYHVINFHFKSLT